MLSRKTIIVFSIFFAAIAFFTWRFLRPMNIFVVDPKFERPIDSTNIPPPLRTLRATECASCHEKIYNEWKTTIHSQAWTDPYFQVDWKFDKQQQVCKNCHIPLDRQQEHKVLGFRDREKWDPVLVPNPLFDEKLQHEGVTCAACHVRDGKIIGIRGTTDAPHPVTPIQSGNEICIRCHVVEGDRWDTFFRLPPCGTVAEIQTTKGKQSPKDLLVDTVGKTGEITATDLADLGCVQCHMPIEVRPVTKNGKPRPTRKHLWRGGHDPAMVKSGLKIEFNQAPTQSTGQRAYALTITNIGAAHYLPTGTPDRHLSVVLRALDQEGNVLHQQKEFIKRTVMWRPFIIDLWDTRLPRGQPRSYRLEFSTAGKERPVSVEAVVRYHLLDEKRRRRIGYVNKTPISYEVYRDRIEVSPKTNQL